MGFVLQVGSVGTIEVHRLDVDKDFPTSQYSLWSEEKQQRLELTKKEAKEIVFVLLEDMLKDES